MTSEATSVTTAPTAEAGTPVTGAEPREDGGTRGNGGWLSGRRVLQVAALLISVQLIVRGWVAASGYFWQDDLEVVGLAGKLPLLSSDFLLYDQDGHLMPLGFLLTGLFTRMAPFAWWPMVVALVVLQALASLAVWRLLRLLLGDRPVLLLPLLLYLFSPLTLTAFAWWIAALNALPLQAGLAWVTGDAIKLLRTGRRRYAATGAVVFALTLFSFEKALVVPVVAFTVVVLLLRQSGEPGPIVAAARAGRWLWGGLAVVVGAWFWVYSSVVGSPVVESEGSGTVATAVEMVRLGVIEGILPALLGGPLVWADFGLFASPPAGLVVAGGVTAVATVVWTAWSRQGCGVVWWLVAAYVAVSAAAMVLGRLNAVAPVELPLSLRYFSDSVVIVALALALVIRAPARTDQRRLPTEPLSRLPVTAATAAVVFLAASLWSTVSFTRIWDDTRTRDYVATVRTSLAETAGTPIFDQGIPGDVLWGVHFPNNLVSHVFAPLPELPRFADATPELRMLDDSGRLIEAEVEPLRWITDGPLDGCGHGVSGRHATLVPLDGPLVALPWTVQLNYLAGKAGFIEVSLNDEWIRTPVQQGPNTVYVRVIGGGESLRVRSVTDGLAVCLDSGVVGHMQPVRSR